MPASLDVEQKFNLNLLFLQQSSLFAFFAGWSKLVQIYLLETAPSLENYQFLHFSSWKVSFVFWRKSPPKFAYLLRRTVFSGFKISIEFSAAARHFWERKFSMASFHGGSAKVARVAFSDSFADPLETRFSSEETSLPNSSTGLWVFLFFFKLSLAIKFWSFA